VKILKIEFKEHALFGNNCIDFTEPSGMILETVIFIGDNGTGKTTLLNAIADSIRVYPVGNYKVWSDDNIIEGSWIAFPGDSATIFVQCTANEMDFLETGGPFSHLLGIEGVEGVDIESPAVIYLPVEANFKQNKGINNTLVYHPKFMEVIDSAFTANISSFIATKIQSEVFKNVNEPPKISIQKACDEINHIFEIMDVDAKLVGLSADGTSEPIFKNGQGKSFNIESLSSGEKQLFIRALSLKFLNANNCMILIDEPELSLHPEWQRKIVHVYEQIGENNQIIIATHSPHIVGSVRAKSIRILRRGEEGIEAFPCEEDEQTYGRRVDDILQFNMNINSLRNEEISNKLKRAGELLDKGDYKSYEFQKLIKELKDTPGSDDKDLMRLELAVAIKESKDDKGE